MKEIPFGSWPSALTAERILAGALRLGQPQLDGGDVYWLEGRPSEGGRQVIVRSRGGRVPEDVNPVDTNVRTRVHEYGGGDFRVRAGEVVFANFADQRVYRLGPETPADAKREDLGAPWGVAGCRYADFAWSPDGRFVVAVEERHPEDGGEAENRLVALRVDDPDRAPIAVAAGCDFVSFPTFSPDGSELAYTCWDHPQMPWDGTRLLVQAWGEDGPEGAPEPVAGGDDESIFQPRFSPDGLLGFVSDRSGWWNLYARDGSGEIQALCPLEAEFGQAQWVFGLSCWDWIDAREILCRVGRGGRDRLCRLRLAESLEPPGRLTDLALPFTSVGGVQVEGDTACWIGASAERAAGVYVSSLSSGKRTQLRSSFEIELDASEISIAEAIEFPTERGRTAHAFFYAPKNPSVVGPPDARPPLLVKGHGGPTASAQPVLNLSIQYWTSRGFAVVDVNYGGSTGYGRRYRERLRGAWGIVDVEDCANAARYLAEQGRVDSERLAISGGSAGGYTTLCALTFQDLFAAGASHYGIGDLEALARDTHKFESRYTDGLVGPYPERADLYRARSPIHFTERLSCPVIFFQGLEDRVVPPNQAEAMVDALAKQGIPHAYVAFPGEQHGFRDARNIRTALEGELYFYGQIFGFDVDVQPGAVKIVR